MATTNVMTEQQSSFTNQLIQGDCIEVMRRMRANSIDFVLTDPPYLVNYRDRSGRSIKNDVNSDWLKPAMAQAYRVLKPNHITVMFYGWTKVDEFFAAWKEAGFRPVGHIVFRKQYSSKSRFLGYQHEQGFLLANDYPPLPKELIGDVIDMPYSGNKRHPTQKPVTPLEPVINFEKLPMLLECFKSAQNAPLNRGTDVGFLSQLRCLRKGCIDFIGFTGAKLITGS